MKSIESRVTLLGVLFSSAIAIASLTTNLRVGLAGPGEVLMLLWIVVFFCFGGYICNVLERGPISILFLSLMLAFLGFSIGSLYGYSILGLSMEWESAVKFLYLIAVFYFFYCYLDWLFGMDPYLARKALDVMVHAYVISSFVVCLAAFLFYADSFIFAGRFNAFSKNPNQVAFVGSVGFLLSSLLMVTRFWRGLLLAFISLFIGLASMSDVFVLAAVFSILLLLIRLSFSRYFLIFIFMCLVFLFFQEFLLNAVSSADEGDSRTILALNGILAYLRSPVYGLGFGAYSGLVSPFQGAESHNSYIEWIAGGGVLSILAVLLISREVYSALRSKPYLFLIFLAIFGLTNFVHVGYRHPVFWFAIFYVVAWGLACKQSHQTQG